MGKRLTENIMASVLFLMEVGALANFKAITANRDQKRREKILKASNKYGHSNG